MKKLILATVAVLMAVSVYAFDDQGIEQPSEEKKTPEVWCPATRFTDNAKCMECHRMVYNPETGKPEFGLKELPSDANFAEKPYGLSIEWVDGKKPVGHMTISGINSNDFDQVYKYYKRHPEIDKLVIEMHSPGGSVMAAWRVIGLIEEMRSSGVEIETRCYGLAASAGTILLVSGDLGKRYANKHAEIMIHKLWTFSMFEVSDPDNSEDKANTLKHFQQNINEYMASRTDLSIDELNDKTFKRDWWMTGKEALEYRIVDHLVGE